MILECFSKCLQWQNIDVTEDKISKTLVRFLKNANFYYIDLPKTIMGCTIYDGSIFINKQYFDYLSDRTYSLQALTAIVTTILHELSHVIHRLCRDKSLADFYINTKEKYYDNNIKLKRFKDIGDVFDFILFAT